MAVRLSDTEKLLAVMWRSKMEAANIPLDPAHRNPSQLQASVFMLWTARMEMAVDGQTVDYRILQEWIHPASGPPGSLAPPVSADVLAASGPTPITFSIAPAARSGAFGSSVVTHPGGAYTRLYWELNLPTVTDYVNPANQIVMNFIVNGNPSQIIWQGNDGNVPPFAMEYDISRYGAGTTFQITGSLNNTMNMGIANGKLS
jgi:hypothetical protein